MKATKLFFVILFVLILTPSVIAQESGSQLYLAVKHSVKPEKIEEYKELMGKFASTCKKYDYPGSFSAWRSTSPDFYYFYPLLNYNSIEKLNSEAWEIVSFLESDYAQKFFETIESWDQFFIRRVDSLSYTPENFTAVREDLVYAEWGVR